MSRNPLPHHIQEAEFSEEPELVVVARAQEFSEDPELVVVARAQEFSEDPEPAEAELALVAIPMEEVEEINIKSAN